MFANLLEIKYGVLYASNLALQNKLWEYGMILLVFKFWRFVFLFLSYGDMPVMRIGIKRLKKLVIS